LAFLFLGGDMGINDLLVAQSKLFNFKDCLTTLGDFKASDLSVFADETEFVRLHCYWRALDELGLTSEFDQLKQLIKQSSESRNNLHFIYLLGRIEAENQNWLLAEKYFIQVIAEAEDQELKSRSLVGLGVVRYFEEKYEEAKICFLGALHSESNLDSLARENEIVALLWLAQATNATQETSEAYDSIRRALEEATEANHFYLIMKGHLILIEIALLNNDLPRAESSLMIAHSIIPKTVHTKSLRQMSDLQKKIAEAKGFASFQWIESESRTVLINPERKACTISDYPILMQLLNVLWLHRKGLTKEELFNCLWGAGYHPLHDDNKIYVTIRRLRKMIGDDSSEPRFILCRGSVYSWNHEYRFTRFQQRAFAPSEFVHYTEGK
jgi:tetratricopeptide (TPR) repeat protein